MDGNTTVIAFPLRNRTCWRLTVCVVFALFAGGALLISLGTGSVAVSPEEILRILRAGLTADAKSQVIWNIRLPRTLVGALVGVNLALAGAILQGVLKNPLADPHILGISSGAGLAGVVILVLYPHLEMLVTPVAFCGAMAAAVLIYLLAWKNGIQPVRIILAGVAVSALLGAGISGLLVFYSDRVHGALMWLVGGLAARSWPHLQLILPYTVVGGLLGILGAGRLNIMALGDDIARGLGMHVEKTRLLLTAVAALLAASAVSVAGLLGFVGLIVPHMARVLLGSDHRFLLPASALLGAGVLTLSDTLARTIFSPVELPAGIIMAAFGAPFFLFLLRRA